MISDTLFWLKIGLNSGNCSESFDNSSLALLFCMTPNTICRIFLLN